MGFAAGGMPAPDPALSAFIATMVHRPLVGAFLQDTRYRPPPIVPATRRIIGIAQHAAMSHRSS